MQSPPHARAILAATILGSAMVFIDGTAVSVALPVFQRELHADVAQVQWIVEAYQLFLASLVLVGGSLGDHFGRRRIFLIGIIGFTACSAWCGASPSAGQVILARSVQGIAGALLVPSSLAIISASFGYGRGRAIGTWSAFTSLTLILGPVVGGWLTQHASWRWVFFLNVPLAVIVTLLTIRCVPESHDRNAGALDIPGALLATASLGAIVFGLIESSNRGLRDPVVVGTIAAGVLLLIPFFLREWKTDSPLVPLDLFRNRVFSATNALTLFLYGALSAALFFLPFDLIQVQKYTPTEAGAANLPTIAMMVLLSRATGALADRIGPKLPLIVGPAIAGCGLILFARPSIGGSYWTTFFPPAILLGLGMSITVAPLTTSVMGAAGEERSGVASGINNAVSRAAGLVAVAVVGVFVFRRFSGELLARAAALHVPAAELRGMNRLAEMPVPATLPPAARAALQQAINLSFVSAFRMAMVICAGLAFTSAAVSLFAIRQSDVKRKR